MLRRRSAASDEETTDADVTEDLAVDKEVEDGEEVDAKELVGLRAK